MQWFSADPETLVWYLKPSVLSNGIHSSCIKAAILKSQLLKVTEDSETKHGCLFFPISLPVGSADINNFTCKSLQEERRLARQADEMVAMERSRWDSLDESIPARPNGKVTWESVTFLLDQ